MSNVEISRIFFEIADMLEMQSIDWKPSAYRKAARSIETLQEDVSEMYKNGGINALEEIPGIGGRLAKKIVEYLATGKIREYERLKAQIPGSVEELMHIGGIGAKKAMLLYKKIGINSVSSLEKAARAGKISKIQGFGRKSEQDILLGIKLLKSSKGRMLLGMALPIARGLVSQLKTIKHVKIAEAAGSLRRMKETVGDIDILVISKKPQEVMDFFTTLPDVQEILAKGRQKSAVMLNQGLQADVRVLDEKSFGAALMYFTGSKDHNIMLRQIAIKQGYKLNEYGLFKHKFICGKTEKEVYSKLGFQFIPPEIRENQGEFNGHIPNLVGYGSIKGDLQVHSTWSDGTNSPEEMIQQAIKMGYEYIAITDHSKRIRIAGGMDGKKVMLYLAELEKLQKQYPEIRIFKGSEVDILPDGKLDFGNKILGKLDFVIGSVHSGFKMPKQEMTNRLCNAIESGKINVLGHPTGRVIGEREPYQLDFDKVCETAKNNNVALEINAFPTRLDLNDSNIRRALDFGCRFTIGTDSHSASHLQYMELGIGQARRGWLESKDVLNTLAAKQLEKFIYRGK